MNRRRAAPRAPAPRRPRVQLRRHAKRHAVAAIARHRRPRPVGRQVELLGQTRERARPERQLARDRLCGSLSSPSSLALPQRVVGVLHRQRRQRRAPVRRAPRRRARGRASSGAVDQPSPAMWCSTAAARARRAPSREQLRPQRQARSARSNGAAPRAATRRAGSASRDARRHGASRGRAAAGVAGSRWHGTAERRREDRAQRSRAARPRRRARASSAPHVELARQPQRHRRCCRSRSGLPAGRGTTAAAARTTAAPRAAARDGAASAGRACWRRRRRAPGQPVARSAPRTAARSGSSTPKRGADPRDQPGRQQRVAAELEEVVVDADPLERPAPRRPDRTAISSVRRARRAHCRRAVSSGAGSALRSSLPLAVSGSASSTTNAAGTM